MAQRNDSRWMLSLLLVGAGVCCASERDPWDVFALDGRNNIMAEEHFGIVNGQATLGVNFKDCAALRGLWAPPYVSSDFALDMRLFGEPVPTAHYVWRPIEVEREGRVRDIGLRSVVTLAGPGRAGLLTIELTNGAAEDAVVPVEFTLDGTLDRTDVWEFARTESRTPAPPAGQNQRIVKVQGEQAIEVRIDAAEARWQESLRGWRMDLALAAGAARTVHVAFSMDRAEAAGRAADTLVADAEKAAETARQAYREQVIGLFDRLPRIESDNKDLEAFYNRSLVHFLTNRWNVPEFVLHPYYGTGSVKGGCVCNYLWNFGEVWELLPLYDPKSAREHIQQFLRVDITTHFAFMPVTGEAFGPWYPVNQEKIIGLIYYYVKNTGDRAFLNEAVNGKTVLEWVLHNAMWRDDPAQPVALIDYGPSNSHLELRRGFPYNHIMPDLNGRRYNNYVMAAELAELMGTPAPELRPRAEALKALLKQELWDANAKWFRFRNDQGKDDLRYTMQIFKFFGSPVLDAEEQAGLLSHLNEQEFLSDFGFHSMARHDIAYDQVDIDNGGGGSCTSFPPQIAERLYKSGRPAEADDILRRMLWSGQHMPYWGDSLVANHMDYRKDTPLQCTLDGVAAAQCILFGMMGIASGFDGHVTVCPHLPSFAQRVRLTGVKIRGIAFDLAIDASGFDVTHGGQTQHAPLGTSVQLTR